MLGLDLRCFHGLTVEPYDLSDHDENWQILGFGGQKKKNARDGMFHSQSELMMFGDVGRRRAVLIDNGHHVIAFTQVTGTSNVHCTIFKESKSKIERA